MLNVKNIEKTFNKGSVNEKQIFHNFSLKINKNDFITIIGSNGAGKSTLLNLIAGNEMVDNGQIVLNNKIINHQVEYKRAKYISRVYQNPALGTSPNMTISENLSLVLNKKHPFSLRKGVTKKKTNDLKEIVAELELGLENNLETLVGGLSGGQRQALALLMAAIAKPKLLLLDEHTAALDPDTAKRINELTKEIVIKQNITTLMVTHNMKDALEMGNRLIMIDHGKIILDISGKEKQGMTTTKLLDLFKLAKEQLVSDRMLFSI